MTDQAVTPDASAGQLIDPIELEAIFVEVLDALVTNAGMDLDAPIPAEDGVEQASIRGMIAVHADTEATLTVDTDTQACARLARCWGLIGPDGATREDLADALGELCNLVGATVKTVFDEESHVGIPEVSDGAGSALDAEPVTIDHPTGVFIVRFGPGAP